MKKIITNNRWLIALLFLSIVNPTLAQTAVEIIQKVEQNLRGKSSYAEMQITVQRPKWDKTMQLKSWSKGDDMSVSIVTAPAKEKGIVFLMRDKEVWNYMPSIDRTIKMPPSMMMQNWMGTDLTNDDLIKQSSIVDDYTHQIVGEETIEGFLCWKIELKPKENAAVVWGKLEMWVAKKEFIQLKVAFYDEDDFLVNTMLGSKVKDFGKRTLPSVFTVIPEEKEGNKTIIEYKVWQFDLAIDEKIFSPNYMKRIR